MVGERSIFVHSYLNEPGNKKPDRRSRLVWLAALEEFRNLKEKEKIGKICLSVESSLATPQIKRAKKILSNSIKDGDIVVYQRVGSVSTREEVKSLKEMMGENNWSEVIEIGLDVHLPRIRKEGEKAFGGVNPNLHVVSAEEILSKYSRYGNVYEAVNKWPEVRAMIINEKLVADPNVGEKILQWAEMPYIRPLKVVAQSVVLRTIEGLYKAKDKYNRLRNCIE